MKPEIIGPGLARMADRYGEMLLFSKRKLRKSTHCRECDCQLSKGTFAYGEAVSTAASRMDRYCVRCVEKKS